MSKIYKYVIPIGKDSFYIPMPKDAKILKLELQNGIPVFWAIVDINEESILRKFVTIGTGWEMDDKNLSYIGTYPNDYFIWHIFEVIK